MTQRSFIKDHCLVGVGDENGDLSFPDLSKLAPAYGLEYMRSERMEDMEAGINWAMMLSSKQVTEPKAASKRLDDGTIYSAPLEDMAPFLPEEEVNENMYIPRIHVGGTEETVEEFHAASSKY